MVDVGVVGALCSTSGASCSPCTAAGRPLASAIFALVVLQAVTGIGVVVMQVPPLLAGTHQVMAAITLWVAVVHATRLAADPVRAATPSLATRKMGWVRRTGRLAPGVTRPRRSV